MSPHPLPRPYLISEHHQYQSISPRNRAKITSHISTIDRHGNLISDVTLKRKSHLCRTSYLIKYKTNTLDYISFPSGLVAFSACALSANNSKAIKQSSVMYEVPKFVINLWEFSIVARDLSSGLRLKVDINLSSNLLFPNFLNPT